MKKTVVIIQLFVVLLWANSAIAAKPPAEIVLIGGPTDGRLICDIHNRTDTDITLIIDFCIDISADGTVAEGCQENTPVTLVGHSSYRLPQSGGVETRIGTATCEVTYIGKKGDITGQFCGSDGCVQLQ